ncbi:hypothetical protein PWT90_10948 [Aphanocladium album]|nr:hypothetical protein PWT90_10948 [Aphanocladium album]
MDIISSAPPKEFISIGYFEGYGLTQPCDRVDVRTIDVKKYTHIQFAFSTVTANTFEVDMGPTLNQFYYFKQLNGVKRILSFGGWTFSTDPATYGIFRTGVTPEHRQTMANNIAKFIIDQGLDGVDIDWEYPAAPDIPGIPAADPAEGANYLKFMIALRGVLPKDKSLSFAAPASSWYLKGFPIAIITKIVDYVVYMTYDLHGQWDYGNKWSSPGCPGSNCLRSHVNMTETINALSMITKAGAPSNKIAVGLTSYGRSFKMLTSGCTGPMCTFAGPQSQAKPGRCTGTAGYISQNEIDYVLRNNPSAQKTHDAESNSDILVDDTTEWVSYMDRDTKEKRKELYQALHFLGTSDWAVSLDGADLVKPDPSTIDANGPSLLADGLTDLKLHSSCLPYREIWTAWDDAGTIAKAPYNWSRFNKYQKVLNNYLGKKSGQVPILITDAIWKNFERHSEIHHGPREGLRIYLNIYCDQYALPRKFTEKPKEERCNKLNRDDVVAATYRFPGTWFWSEYYILLCPAFLGKIPKYQFTDLKDLKKEADSYPLLQTEINRWSGTKRGVTMYYEVAHLQDVSNNPTCDNNELYDPRRIVLKAQGGYDRDYEFHLANAHSWTLSALGMWMMKTFNLSDPPMPRGTQIQQRDGDDGSGDETGNDIVDQNDDFDPSQIDPTEFFWMSRLGYVPNRLHLYVTLVVLVIPPFPVKYICAHDYGVNTAVVIAKRANMNIKANAKHIVVWVLVPQQVVLF